MLMSYKTFSWSGLIPPAALASANQSVLWTAYLSSIGSQHLDPLHLFILGLLTQQPQAQRSNHFCFMLISNSWSTLLFIFTRVGPPVNWWSHAGRMLIVMDTLYTVMGDVLGHVKNKYLYPWFQGYTVKLPCLTQSFLLLSSAQCSSKKTVPQTVDAYGSVAWEGCRETCFSPVSQTLRCWICAPLPICEKQPIAKHIGDWKYLLHMH